jgi:hypothetical protein
VHSIQEADVVEYMGIIMPRIYASLDNKQAKFRYYMVEVEGKINDQPISILIDSGAIHSYIDPKMVESLHLARSKHGESVGANRYKRQNKS